MDRHIDGFPKATFLVSEAFNLHLSVVNLESDVSDDL
jgi:hypothetical protein